MARKKRRRIHKKRMHHTKAKHRARRRSGFSKSSSGSLSIDSLKKTALASAVLRLVSGAGFYFLKKQGLDSGKTRMILPAVVAFAASKKWIPIEGLAPLAISQTVNAVIDNFDFLKNIFDLKMLDSASKPAPTAGLNARTFAETRNALSNMHYERAGLQFRRAGYQYDRSGLQMSPNQVSAYSRSGVGGYNR
jgi:hypothetical protein